MKIICEKSTLMDGINIATKAVASKSSMSILECILIDATEDNIKLISNNMETFGIETIIEGEISEKGMVAIKSKYLSDIVRSMPNGKVTIETTKNGEAVVSHIYSGSASFDINSKSGEEFSFLPYVEKEESFEISQYSLKEIIKQTIFSIATSENNKLMTGVLFEIKNNKLKVATLDGNRISQRIIELKDCNLNKRITVPGKTLQEISKIIPGELEKKVEIFITENHIVFNYEDTTVVSRLIEGEYFNIDQMISKEYNTKVLVNKNDLLTCIERSKLLISEGEKKPIIINITDGSIEIKIKSQMGQMDEKISVEKEGSDLLIGFNPIFFTDALKVIDDEFVSLYFTASNSPCFIRDDKESYDYLLLPLKFSKETV